MRMTMLVLFVLVASLWAATALATVAIWRGRGERPNRDLAGAVAELAACSSGLLVVGIVSQ